MPIPIGGRFDLRDNVQNREVPITVIGTVDYRANQPPSPQLDQHVQMALQQAIKNVITQKMMSGQLTFRNLGEGTWASAMGEIIAASGLQANGIQIGNLELHFGIDGHPPQTGRPQQPQQQQQQQPQQPQYNVGAHIHVAGLNINASTDKGLDTHGLQNQLANKAKSEITWWAIGCGVLALVGIFVVGLGIYIWRTAATSMSATTTSRSATAAKWDGKSPFTCGGNDSVTLTGVKASLSSTAITANGNCTLTLSNVDITAPTAIEANGNANVTVTGGSLNGSTYAVKANGLAKVNMTGTTVTGKTLASGAAKITGP
jgi:hypothetical protein